MKKYYILVYSSRSATDRIILFLNLKKKCEEFKDFFGNIINSNQAIQYS
jgi:hypothetical protein